jgi:hypothetical protein
MKTVILPDKTYREIVETLDPQSATLALFIELMLCQCKDKAELQFTAEIAIRALRQIDAWIKEKANAHEGLQEPSVVESPSTGTSGNQTAGM